MSAGSVERTESFLVACAAEIRRRGIKLVYNAGEVWDGSNVVGCCLTHAQEQIPSLALAKLGRMELPDGELEFDRAWDAIERGFDGLSLADDTVENGYRHPAVWHDLGSRLRVKLRPGDAMKLEARIARRRS